MFATGFDITTADKVGEVVGRFKKTVGIRRLKSLHVNDSMTPLGSNRDRHAIPGEGEIGPKGCAAFLSEPRFEKLPGLFEGPGTSGHAPDKVDVDTMKKLRKKGLAARKR
jgi:deoxyribonuclease-4